MMTLLDKTQMIRLHVQGKSNREIGRIMKVSRNAVGKYVRECERLQSELEACDPEDTGEVRRIADAITAEPSYDSSSRGARKWNADMDALLDEILAAEDERRRLLGPNKQALTKAQIHGLIVGEGHRIGLTTVSRRIDEKRSAGKDAFMAQAYEYGDGFEYDFGEVKLYSSRTSRAWTCGSTTRCMCPTTGKCSPSAPTTEARRDPPTEAAGAVPGAGGEAALPRGGLRGRLHGRGHRSHRRPRGVPRGKSQDREATHRRVAPTRTQRRLR